MIVRPPIGQPRFSIVVLLPPLSAHNPSRELPRSIRIRTETRSDLSFIHLLPSPPSGSVVARHWSGINLQSRYFLDKQVARIGGAALALILSFQNKNKKIKIKIKIKKHLPLLVGSHLVQSPLESLATVSVVYDLVGDLFHINQPAHILQKINPWPGRRKQKNTYIAGEHQGLTIGSM